MSKTHRDETTEQQEIPTDSARQRLELRGRRRILKEIKMIITREPDITFDDFDSVNTTL